MNTKDLQELNNSNFSDTPVASQQATESISTNNKPVVFSSQGSNQPKMKVVGKGKNKKIVPETSITAYDLNNSSEFQKQLGYYDHTGGIDGVFRTQFGDEYFDSKWMGLSLGTVNNTTSDPYMGRNSLNPNIDFEDLRRNSQSTVGATANTVSQFAGKTLVNTVGGIVGGFYSLGSAVVNWDANKLFDNSVNRALDTASEWVDENNSVFTSERARQEQGMLGFNVETMKNLSDGFSFIAGAVLSEIVTGGISSGSLASTSLGALSRSSRLGKLGLNTAVALQEATSTGLLPALKSYGNVIKRTQDALELVDETNRFTRGLSQAQRAERLAGVLGDTAGVVEDAKKYSEALRAYGNMGKMFRTTVTGTFWEAGLEGRQARDEFYDTNLKSSFAEIDAMDISEDEKNALKQSKEQEINSLADNVGLLTFGLNSMVLRASNAVQFPTLFGSPTKLNPNRFTGSFKKLATGNFELPKNIKYSDAIRYFGAVIKNPITEGLEELSQGVISGASQDYYKDILASRTNDKVLQGPVSSFLNNVGNYLDSVGNTIEENASKKEFWQEGVIGAVMGATGIPMLKRNKNGKLRKVGWSGGIYEDVADINNYRKDRVESLTRLNTLSNDLDDINGYNVDRAKRMELLNRRDDLSMLTNNEQQFLDDRQNKIFNIVSDMKNKGLDSYLTDTMDEINSLSLEEYESRFGYPAESLTKDQMEAEKKDMNNSIKNWSEAYDMVYNKLNMDDVQNSRVGSKMFDLLVHSVGYEQYLNKQMESVRSNIINSGFLRDNDITEEEFNGMVKDTIEYKTALENFDFRLNEVIDKEYNNATRELAQEDLEFQDTLSVLPSNVQSIINNGFNEYNELVRLGKKDEANNVLDNINSSLSSALSEKDINVNGKSVNDTVKQAIRKKTELSKKVNNLDKNQIKDSIIKRNDDNYKLWEKELKDEIKEINKVLKEKHEKDTALLLNPDQAQQLSLDQVLNVINNNNRYKNAVRQASIRIQNQENSLLTKLQKDAVNINNELDKFEFIYAKKISTVRMASQLLNVRPNVAYKTTALMEFDANMENLQQQVYELEYSFNNIGETDLDVIVIDLSYVEASYDKINLDMKSLQDDFNVGDKKLENIKNYLTYVKELIDRVNNVINVKDAQEEATKEALEKDVDNTKQEGVKATNERIQEENKLATKEDDDTFQIKDRISFNNDTTSTPKEQEALDKFNNEKEIVENNLKTPFVTKEFYTVYPSLNSDTGNQSIDGRSIGEKILDGTIKCNQTATLEIPVENELSDPSFTSYLQSRGVSKENYIDGKNKLEKLVEEGNEAELNVDFYELDDNIRDYILNTRLYFNIYDSQIIRAEGVQTADISNAEQLHRMYFYAPENISEQDVKNRTHNTEREILELSREAETKKQEVILNNDLSDLDKADSISRINYEYSKKIDVVKEQLNTFVGNKNFFTNFALRRSALIENLKEKEPLMLRIGNFLNGYIQPSSLTESDYVDNYSLTDLENPLIDDLDTFDLNKLFYINSKLRPTSFVTGEAYNTNTGSLINKVMGNTGEVYLSYTTRNGQDIPVKLNRNRYGYNEEILNGIVNIAEEYFKSANLDNRRSDKINVGANDIMSVFNGKTYEEFFTSMFRQFKGKARLVNSNDTGTAGIDTKGNVWFGGLEIKSIDEFNSNKGDIYRLISNTRTFVNHNYISTDNNTFNDFGKWLVTNGLLSHTFNTSENTDKIFVRDDSNPVPFQIHMLNTTIEQPSPKLSGVKNQLKEINLLFTNNPRSRYREFTPYELNKVIMNKLSNLTSKETDEITDSKLGEIIDNMIQAKQEDFIKFFENNMGLATDLTWNFSKGQYKIKDLIAKLEKSVNSLDLYLYSYLSFLNKLKNKKDGYKLVKSYARKSSLPLDIKKLLLNNSSSTVLGGLIVNSNNEVDSVNTRLVSVEQAKKVLKEANLEDNGTKKNLLLDQVTSLKEEAKNKYNNVFKALKLLNRIIIDNNDISEAFNKNKPLDKNFLFNGDIVEHKNASKNSFRNTLSYSVNSENEVTENKVKFLPEKQGSFSFSSNLYQQYPNIPITFYALINGDLVKTENPERDFVYDSETGELLNGLVKFRLRKADKEGSFRSLDYVFMKGSGIDNTKIFSSGTAMNVVSRMNIPGLDINLDLDPETFSILETLDNENKVNTDSYNTIKTMFANKDVNLDTLISDNSNADDKPSSTGKSILSGVKNLQTRTEALDDLISDLKDNTTAFNTVIENGIETNNIDEDDTFTIKHRLDFNNTQNVIPESNFDIAENLHTDTEIDDVTTPEDQLIEDIESEEINIDDIEFNEGNILNVSFVIPTTEDVNDTPTREDDMNTEDVIDAETLANLSSLVNSKVRVAIKSESMARPGIIKVAIKGVINSLEQNNIDFDISTKDNYIKFATLFMGASYKNDNVINTLIEYAKSNYNIDINKTDLSC